VPLLGLSSAVALLNSLTAHLQQRIKDDENLCVSPTGRQSGAAVAVLSIFNPALDPQHQTSWTQDHRLLVPAAVIVAAGNGGSDEMLTRAIRDLESFVENDSDNPERQSLALFLLVVAERRRPGGNPARFKDYLRRLLQRERMQPEPITRQASRFSYFFLPFSFNQGFGSGFSDFVDPDPYWKSGSRDKKIKKFQWKNCTF
jgi:hypothetical protein